MRSARTGRERRIRFTTPGWVLSACFLLVGALGVLAYFARVRIPPSLIQGLHVVALALGIFGQVLLPGLLIGLGIIALILAATQIRHSWRRAQRATYESAWRLATQQATDALLQQIRMLEHAHLKTAVMEAQTLLRKAIDATDPIQHTLWLQEVDHSLHRLRRLVVELHGHLSQPPDTGTTGSALPQDLERTLREVTRNFRTLVPHCTLEVAGYPHTPIPENARAALVVGLYNALTNAHVHGKAQRVQVRLEYNLTEVVLRVSDNGCGFDVGRARRQTHGRGLADLISLTERQDGTVTISSSVGRGTEIRMALPLVRPPLGWAAQLDDSTGGARTAQYESSSHDRAITLPPWKRKVVLPPTRRILVVDDMAIVRDRLCDLLGRHGYATMAVESGEAATAVVGSGQYIALALLDILMPEAQIEGIEAARVLTHDYDIRCLMLTTVQEVATRAAALFAGALGYLVKDVVTGDAAILAGVRAALAGEPIPDPLAGLTIDRTEALSIHQRRRFITDAYAQLTLRQREVAALAAQGLTNKEIAARLHIEVATVNSHMQEVLAKLRLVGRRELQTRIIYDSLLDRGTQ